jgi:glycosyltransferase involved in cell wall biosynthesis
MIRLLIVSAAPTTGLQYHRQLVPHTYLSDMVEFRCDVFPSYNFSDEFLKQYQGVVFLRNINTNGQSSIIVAQLKRLEIKIIFDIDDYWNLPQGHHLHQLYRQKNLAQQTEFDIKNADLVTTTTEHFAQELRKLNPNVLVLPNCLDQGDQWQAKPIESTLVRFGWIGGVYHERDIEMISHSVQKVYSGLEGFQFVLGGYQPNPSYQRVEKVLSNNYNQPEDYTNYLKSNLRIADHFSWHQKYRRVWGTDVLNYGKIYNEVDVSLVPLEASKFGSFKSEIKLIEAGTHGKAAIVSRVKPYDIFPENTVHYVDNSDYSGWFKAIRKMLKEPEYRAEKAHNLKEYVKESYNIFKWNEVRKQAYKRMFE